MTFKLMLFHVGEIILVGTVNFQPFGNIIFPFLTPRLEFHGAGKIESGNGEIALVHMAIYGALGTGDFLVVCHDLVNVLSLLYPGGNDPVGPIEFLLVQRSTFPCVGKQSLVFLKCRGSSIIEVNKTAVIALVTSVTNKGCFQEKRTGVFG